MDGVVLTVPGAMWGDSRTAPTRPPPGPKIPGSGEPGQGSSPRQADASAVGPSDSSEGDLEQAVLAVGRRAGDLRRPGFQEGVDVRQRRGAARLARVRVVVSVVAEVRGDEREAGVVAVDFRSVASVFRAGCPLAAPGAGCAGSSPFQPPCASPLPRRLSREDLGANGRQRCATWVKKRRALFGTPFRRSRPSESQKSQRVVAAGMSFQVNQ